MAAVNVFNQQNFCIPVGFAVNDSATGFLEHHVVIPIPFPRRQAGLINDNSFLVYHIICNLSLVFAKKSSEPEKALKIFINNEKIILKW